MPLRALLVFFLALLASAAALALQHTEDEGSLVFPINHGRQAHGRRGHGDRNAWTFWTNPGREKRALLIIHGLPRNLFMFWPALERNFVVPNTEAGYNFTIVLHTSLSVFCSENDMQTNNTARCPPHTYGNSTAERRATLHRMFAPHHLTLVDTSDPCWTNPEDRTQAQTQYLQGEWRFGGCSGTVHFASRGAQALDSFRGKMGFHKVAIIRTDNCFELKGHAKEDQPVMLDKACADHPGANIVGNLNTIDRYYPADYDHAWMLCDGSRADVFRDAVAAFGLRCHVPCSAPRCPKGFCLGTVNCLDNICESAATLERGDMNFGTLDDYVVANYHNSSSGWAGLGHEPGDRDGEGNALVA